MRAVRSAFRALIREGVVPRVLPPATIHDINRNDRVGALHRAWGYVFTSQIEGAYYEFGVYRGETFRASHRIYREFLEWQQGQLASEEAWRKTAAAKYAAYRHHFYAFDTFEGMPDNSEGNVTFAPGHFFCTLEEFSWLNRKGGLIEGDGVKYFAGTFAEMAQRERQTLAQLQPAVIVNIDCDLYASARDALEIVAPKLMQGCVLLVDDWNTFAARRESGERRAMGGFLADHPEFTVEPWFSYAYVGQAFLIQKNRVG